MKLLEREFHVMMANQPIYDVFIEKFDSLDAAMEYAKYRQSKSIPYENYYVKEYFDEKYIKVYYRNGVERSELE